MFRPAFRKAFVEAGSLCVPPTSRIDGSLIRIVDIGCGTGTSTRILGQTFFQWDNIQITGIDLSQYFIRTGIRLHELLCSNSFSQSINHTDSQQHSTR
jgi:trans-aconitate methyltransferase